LVLPSPLIEKEIDKERELCFGSSV
jgi:hypothetical protein